MNAILFDTLKLARKLEAAGFSSRQAADTAEAMADTLSGGELATKTDTQALKADIATIRSELTATRTDLDRKIETTKTDLERKIETTKADLEQKIETTKTDLERQILASEVRLNTSIAALRTEVELVRRDLTIRLGAMLIGMTGILLTAMRFLVMHP